MEKSKSIKRTYLYKCQTNGRCWRGKIFQVRNKNKIISIVFFLLRIKVDNWNECIAQCCQFYRCNVAYWISSTCLHIECSSDELCQPTKGENSDINDETLYLKIRSIRK